MLIWLCNPKRLSKVVIWLGDLKQLFNMIIVKCIGYPCDPKRQSDVVIWKSVDWLCDPKQLFNVIIGKCIDLGLSPKAAIWCSNPEMH